MTERLHFHFSLSCIREGNGNPLQCFCLENPRDGEPGRLLSMGSHRVGLDWSDLAAAVYKDRKWISGYLKNGLSGRNDYQGAQGNFRFPKICLLSWQWWWFHGYDITWNCTFKICIVHVCPLHDNNTFKRLIFMLNCKYPVLCVSLLINSLEFSGWKYKLQKSEFWKMKNHAASFTSWTWS